MEPRRRAWTMPKRYQLGGKKLFPPPLPDPLQTWFLEFDGSQSLKSSCAALQGDLTLSLEYQEESRRVPARDAASQAPRLCCHAWDWIEYSHFPLPDLEATVSTWIPDPRTVGSLLRLANKSRARRRIRLRLSCRLPAAVPGSRIRPHLERGRWILKGECGSLALVLALHHAEHLRAASNSLEAEIELGPGEECRLRWLFAAGPGSDTAADYLQGMLALDWAGELARRKIEAEAQLEISTGVPEWDRVLALSQKQARLLLEIPPGSLLSSLQAWLLSQALIPCSAGLLERLLEHRFGTGRGKPPSGESHLPGPADLPLDGELLWELQQRGLPADAWIDCLPLVEADLQAWFSPERDQDRDRIPESPAPEVFQIETEQAGGTSATAALGQQGFQEHPGLAGLLGNAIARLQQLQALAGARPASSGWGHIKDTLDGFIADCWDPDQIQFNSRDYLTHRVIGQEVQLAEITAGWNWIRTALPDPGRLLLEIHPARGQSRTAQGTILLHGRDHEGRSRVEEITPQRMVWSAGTGWALTDCAYTWLEHCTAAGFGKGAQIRIKTASSGRQEISHTLPLWSPGFPEDRLDDYLEQNLEPQGRYSSRCGLLSFPEPEARSVQLSWNILAAGGLLRAGKPQLAAELAECWLAALASNLRESGNTYPAWDSQTGLGWGTKNGIEALFPTALFLQTLGVVLRTDGSLVLQPGYELTREIQISCRGTAVLLAGSQVHVHEPGRDPQVRERTETIRLQFPGVSSENSSTW